MAASMEGKILEVLKKDVVLTTEDLEARVGEVRTSVNGARSGVEGVVMRAMRGAVVREGEGWRRGEDAVVEKWGAGLRRRVRGWRERAGG